MSPPIRFQTAALSVDISVSEDEAPHITLIRGSPVSEDSQARSPGKVGEVYPPLVEIRVGGEGNATPSPRTGAALIGSAVSKRLRYVTHDVVDNDDWHTVNFHMRDEKSGLRVTSHLALSHTSPVLRSRSTVRNDSKENRIINQLSSLVVGGVTKTEDWWNTYSMSTCRNTWFREAQWQTNTLPELGLDDFGFAWLGKPLKESKAFHSLSNRTTFSTNGHLPMGMLRHNDGFMALAGGE
jgi:alpha-galactosidase